MNGGNFMNKNIFYLTALLFVFGCSNQNAELEVVTIEEPQSLLLEYMWCDFGPNTSEESLNKLVEDFNDVTKNSEHPVESAWAYVPTFETDSYDAIWLNVWSDQAERNAGWSDWAENVQKDFEGKHNDTLNCREDRMFQFLGTAGMAPRVEWTNNPPFNADYQFCTFKGDNGMKELESIMASFDTWVEGTEKDSMWYVWHDPLFDTSVAGGSVQDGYDYAIGFYWQNNAEREASYAGYNETDLQSRFDEIESCEALTFEGYPIVEPAS